MVPIKALLEGIERTTAHIVSSEERMLREMEPAYSWLVGCMNTSTSRVLMFVHPILLAISYTLYYTAIYRSEFTSSIIPLCLSSLIIDLLIVLF